MRPKKCSAKDCSANGSANPEISFFKFPRDLGRCADWVKNSGNEKLLQVPSRRLNVRKYLCEDHFEENQFFDKFRKRLRRTAVPTIFPCASLSDEAMEKYPVLDDLELVGSKVQGKPSRIILSGLTNKYNTFLLPCSKESIGRASALNQMELPQSEVRRDKVSLVKALNKTTPEEVIAEGSDEYLPSCIRIPCEPSIDGLNSVVPGPGSITYIEGPWSSSEEDPQASEILNDANAEMISRMVVNRDPFEVVEQSANEHIQEIIVHHVEMNEGTCSEHSAQASQSYLEVPSSCVTETKGVQCSDFPIPDCDQLPPDIENLLSSPSPEKHFVIQSKQLANGAQVRVIYSVPEDLKR